MCVCVTVSSSSLHLIKTSVRSAGLFMCKRTTAEFSFLFSAGAEGGAIKGRLWDHDAPVWKINHSDAKQIPVGTDSHPRPRTQTGPLTAAEAPAQHRVTVTHLIQFRGWSHESGCDRAVSFSNVTDFSLLATELMTQWAHRSRTEEVQQFLELENSARLRISLLLRRLSHLEHLQSCSRGLVCVGTRAGPWSKANGSGLHSYGVCCQKEPAQPSSNDCECVCVCVCVWVGSSAFSLTSAVQRLTHSRAHRLPFMWFTS